MTIFRMTGLQDDYVAGWKLEGICCHYGGTALFMILAGSTFDCLGFGGVGDPDLPQVPGSPVGAIILLGVDLAAG